MGVSDEAATSRHGLSCMLRPELSALVPVTPLRSQSMFPQHLSGYHCGQGRSHQGHRFNFSSPHNQPEMWLHLQFGSDLYQVEHNDKWRTQLLNDYATRRAALDLSDAAACWRHKERKAKTSA